MCNVLVSIYIFFYFQVGLPSGRVTMVQVGVSSGWIMSTALEMRGESAPALTWAGEGVTVSTGKMPEFNATIK